MTAAIRVGIGGWSYAPWRETFYPPKWPARRELEYAAARLTAIEVNATYYSRFKPETFAGWAKTVPDGFRFALKGSRFVTTRRALADAGEGVARFCEQGIAELGDRLGPILWQFMPTRRFDPDDLAAFLALLPREVAGLPLRHAVQPRHESFLAPAFVALCRDAGVAIVTGESAEHPVLADQVADFAYVRVETAQAEEPLGFPPAALDAWAARARALAAGDPPAGLPRVTDAHAANPRETFLFFIGAAKERNPAAAMATIARLSA